MLAHWGEDLRQAIGRASRSPSFFASTTLIVAVALGAVASMSTMLDALVLRNIDGVRDPPRLAFISLRGDANQGGSNFSLTSLGELARRQHSFESICGFSTGGLFRVEIGGNVTLNASSLMLPE